ncbi:MAG: DNA polymerase III subunit delta [Pseudomonadota bacterium]
MKLNSRDAVGFVKRPDLTKAGILIYGADPARITLRRKALIEAVVGPEAEAEMRLVRLSGADLRSDPAALIDALKAQGFFPGQRLVFVEDATDGTAKAFAAALEEWKAGDAFLVATAGQLAARSALRKTFEGAGEAYALAIYADPPSRDEVEGMLSKAGVGNVSPEGMRDILTLAQTLDAGDFAQTVEKLALYKHGDGEPVSPDDLIAVAPVVTEAAVDDAIAAMANGDVPGIGRQMARLGAQGTGPTTLCISATRHFRQLHAAASSGGRPDEALGRLRPPVFGPRRDAMAAQIRSWGAPRLERALKELMDTDLALRSSSSAPQMAVLERAFIRIAMMRPR